MKIRHMLLRSTQFYATKILQKGPLSKAEISEKLGQKVISGQLNKVIREMLSKNEISCTIPENQTAGFKNINY